MDVIAKGFAALVGSGVVVHYGVLVVKHVVPSLLAKEAHKLLNPENPEDQTLVKALVRWAKILPHESPWYF